MPTNLLKEKNPYFRNLSPEGQQEFITRVARFIDDKYFIGRENLVITDEIRILIAASAVQLTFGLDDYLISHLHTINVFPRVFYSRMFETNFKGLTTQGGVLSLSWDDFREGYAIENDKLNLGLHELAHALNIDLDEGGSDDHFFATGFERFRREAIVEFKLLKNGELPFLRAYGSRNMHEFFAVCIEHFFETPAEFKKKIPHLYSLLCSMLNQDPTNVSGDYAVTEESFSGAKASKQQEQNTNYIKREITITANFDPEPDTAAGFSVKSIQSFIRSKGIYIAMGATFFGLFIGIPLLIWFSSVMMIRVEAILVLLFALGLLGMVQWKYVKNLIGMQYHEFTMYSFTGFGMCMLNLIFLLNYTIRITQYPATFDIWFVQKSGSKTQIYLRGATGVEQRNINNFIENHELNVPEEAKKIFVMFDTGILGCDMVSSCKAY